MAAMHCAAAGADFDGTFGANAASENVARQMTVDRNYPGLRSLLRGGDYGEEELCIDCFDCNSTE